MTLAGFSFKNYHEPYQCKNVNNVKIFKIHNIYSNIIINK